MTGFGKASLELENKNVTVEIRSLNSKGADISFRLPSSLRNYELDLRNELSKKLERGKIDISVYTESLKGETPVEINAELAKSYHRQIKALAAELNEPLNESIRIIVGMPDVMKSEKKEVDEQEWKKIKSCIDMAIEQLDQFRKKEGESLRTDFTERIKNIFNSLNEIKKLDVNRVDTIKERIRKNLYDAVGMDKVDQNRFEQELIYYIEKLDINEEKVRLSTHLDYFLSTMVEASAGRKLNFIAQEIGREINTIGSKASDAAIQKHVVLMKDELEKMKEQTNNVL